jgi:hypothetical protein
LTSQLARVLHVMEPCSGIVQSEALTGGTFRSLRLWKARVAQAGTAEETVRASNSRGLEKATITGSVLETNGKRLSQARRKAVDAKNASKDRGSRGEKESEVEGRQPEESE